MDVFFEKFFVKCKKKFFVKCKKRHNASQLVVASSRDIPPHELPSMHLL